MPGWNSVGSGFSGFEGFRGSNKDKTPNAEISVDTTPDAKRKRLRRNRNVSIGGNKWSSEQMDDHMNCVGDRTEGKEDIDWVSSSENESSPSKNSKIKKKKFEFTDQLFEMKCEKKEDNSDDHEIISQCSSTNSDMSSNHFSKCHDNRYRLIHNKRPNENYSKPPGQSSLSIIPSSTSLTEKADKVARNVDKRESKVSRKLSLCEADVDEAISDVESDSEDFLTSFVSQQVLSETGVAKFDFSNTSQQILTGSCSPHSCNIIENSPTHSGAQQISDLSGELVSPPSSPCRDGITASEWASASLRNESPARVRQQNGDAGFDSGKKKSKFSSGSLSGQLSKLINREKAAVRFWNHSLKSGVVDEANPKSIKVELLQLRKQFSLYVCDGQMCTVSDKENKRKLLLPTNTVESLNLKSGDTVQIFPPWKQLEDGTGVCTLLCTHFIRVVSQSNQGHQAKLENVTQKNIWDTCDLQAVWKCPCVTGPYLLKEKCPSVLKPASFQCDHWYRKSKQLPTDVSIFDNTRLELVSVAGSDSAAAVQHAGASVSDSCVDGKNKHGFTLLEAIEAKDSLSSQLPPFSATVLRVFIFDDRYEVLIQDRAGAIALLKDVPATHSSDSNFPITQLEDCTCSWERLSILSRSNSEREPSLFNIVSQTWKKKYGNSHHLLNDHQTESSSQSQGSDCSNQFSKPPNFCYVLKSLDEECLHFRPLIGSGEKTRREHMPTHHLRNLIEQGLTDCVSFFALLVQVSSKNHSNSNASNRSSVFVLGQWGAEHRSYKVVTIPDSYCFKNVNGVSSPTWCYFRDVYIESGAINCNKFSLVLLQSSWSLWGLSPTGDLVTSDKPALNLVRISTSTHLDSLVSVRGTICDVDEDSSHCWDLCDQCRCDKLVSDDNGNLFCVSCNRQVISPFIKIEMVVFLCCESLPQNCLIRADLSEKTIKYLLPSDESSEGYDVESVTGKHVLLPVCHVKQIDRKYGQEDTQKKGDYQLLIRVKEMTW